MLTVSIFVLINSTDRRHKRNCTENGQVTQSEWEPTAYCGNNTRQGPSHSCERYRQTVVVILKHNVCILIIITVSPGFMQLHKGSWGLGWAYKRVGLYQVWLFAVHIISFWVSEWVRHSIEDMLMSAYYKGCTLKTLSIFAALCSVAGLKKTGWACKRIILLLLLLFAFGWA